MSAPAHPLPASAFELARVLLSQTGEVESALHVTSTHLEVALRTEGVVAVLSSSLPAAPAEDAATARTSPGGSPHDNASPGTDDCALQLELAEATRGAAALSAELDEQTERLRLADDRFRLLLDSVQDYAVCTLNPRGDVVSWNAGAERLFGYDADEIVGRSFASFYPDDERERGLPDEHLAAAAHEGRVQTDGVRLRRGGSSFDADVLLTSVHAADDSLCGYTLVVRDTTTRRRLEEDLRRRGDDLASANRAKEEFLATLSHELRTPLNAMLGWTRLLRMGKLQGRARDRALETIERNARVQEQLIADILDLSRIVTGKLRLAPRPMELATTVDEALGAVRPAADAKGLELVVDMTSTGLMLGDADRLQQVVWNLLANAIKFTPAGGRVVVSVSRAGAEAVITVSDTGEGIPPELLPFIFDRFQTGDASATRVHGGLGLGLSIVRHIVELHGGRVEASSDGEGEGATFSVYLPFRAVQEQTSPHQLA